MLQFDSANCLIVFLYIHSDNIAPTAPSRAQNTRIISDSIDVDGRYSINGIVGLRLSCSSDIWPPPTPPPFPVKNNPMNVRDLMPKTCRITQIKYVNMSTDLPWQPASGYDYETFRSCQSLVFISNWSIFNRNLFEAVPITVNFLTFFSTFSP